MKRIFMTIVAAALMTTAMAQQQGPRQMRQFDPKEMVQHQTDRMAEQLALTEEQKAAVFQLNTELNKNMPQRQRGQQMDEEQQKQMHEQMQKAMQTYEEGLKQVLTEEQMAKYTEMRKQQRERMSQRGDGNNRRRGGNNYGGPHRDRR